MSVTRRLYDIVRSRLPRGKEICLHSWQTIDYIEYADEYGTDRYYEIGCHKCNTIRRIGEDYHKSMKKEGLLI